MELGTRLRYGMLAMLALARRRAQDGACIPMRAEDIAKTEGLSKGYLEGLLATLRRAGLVRAVRGPGGGWVLARPAGALRPIDIYAALEGTTALVPCVEKRRLCPLSAGKAKKCRARSIWVAMTRALEKTLRARTLAVLAGVTHKSTHKSTRKATKKKSSVAKKKTRGAKARPKAKAKKSADKRKAAVVRNREIVKVVRRARLRRSA